RRKPPHPAKIVRTLELGQMGFLPLARVVDENDIVPMVVFGPYEQVGSEVILLKGREIVYLSAHDANRLSLGEFWRSISFADLKDHAIKNYLKRIADKRNGTIEVPYIRREQFVSRDNRL